MLLIFERNIRSRLKVNVKWQASNTFELGEKLGVPSNRLAPAHLGKLGIGDCTLVRHDIKVVIRHFLEMKLLGCWYIR